MRHNNRQLAVVITPYKGWKCGDYGYVSIIESLRDNRESTCIYKAPTGEDVIYSSSGVSSIPREYLLVVNDNLKGNPDLLNVINEETSRLEFLKKLYDTGEIPPTPEMLEKANAILATIKAVKNDDDTAALNALLIALSKE